MDEAEFDEKMSNILMKITGKKYEITKIQDKSLLSAEIGLSPLDLLDLFFLVESEFNIKFIRNDITSNRLDVLANVKKIIC